MGFFRKRLTPEEAFDKVLAAISSWPPLPSDLPASLAALGGEPTIRREQAYLSLMAALVALRFSRNSDWRLNGQELFTTLGARVMQDQAAESGSDNTLLEQAHLTDSINIYNLALEIAAPNISAANIRREIGKSFAMLLGEKNCASLSALGEQTFSQAFDRVVDITTSFKL